MLALASEILIPQSLKVPALEGAFTLTFTFCPALGAKVPEVGDNEHHVPDLPATGPAVQLSVAVPVFLILNAWAGGVAPPEVAVKEKVWELKKILGVFVFVEEGVGVPLEGVGLGVGVGGIEAAGSTGVLSTGVVSTGTASEADVSVGGHSFWVLWSAGKSERSEEVEVVAVLESANW